MRRLWCVLVGILAATAQAKSLPFGANDVAPTGLNKQQVQQVLVVVLKHEKFRLSDPGMYIDSDLNGPNGDPDRPGYFNFSLSYENPKAAATAYLGDFAVNIKTGDVWETESCVRYRFPALRALQREIVRRTGTPLAAEKSARDEVGCPSQATP
jgi:hypothetical protein